MRHRLRFINRFGLLSAALILIVASVADGQSAAVRSSQSLPIRSVAGQQIVSIPVDPFMNRATEQEIFRRLSQPLPTNFECSNLIHLQQTMQQYVTTTINIRALDDIGLTVDIPIEKQFPAGTLVGAALTQALRDHDLTWQIHRGIVEITTNDDAEHHQTTRIYDVTPIVVRKAYTPASPNKLQNVAFYDRLRESLETAINPDTWDSLGGTSTMVGQSVGDRCLLTVTTTTAVHLQVICYLNQINRLGYPKASDAADLHAADR